MQKNRSLQQQNRIDKILQTHQLCWSDWIAYFGIKSTLSKKNGCYVNMWKWEQYRCNNWINILKIRCMLVIKIVLAIMFSQYYRMIYIFNILVCSALFFYGKLSKQRLKVWKATSQLFKNRYCHFIITRTQCRNTSKHASTWEMSNLQNTSKERL